MLLQLLWVEIVVKCAAGGLLTLFPRTIARVLGLPPVGETFWPRLLGATLLGIAGATFLEGQFATSKGLGLAGHIAINLAAALLIISTLIMGRAGTARRGRFFLGLAAAGLSVLALVELAYT